MENMDSIYTDIIMEASTSKHNKHNLTNPDFTEHGHNPSCGDDITLELKMNGDILEDISFTGTGCAISQASTTIMIDLFKGKTKQEVLKLIDIYLRMIKEKNLRRRNWFSRRCSSTSKHIKHASPSKMCRASMVHNAKNFK